jgi:hypothetical protein
MSAMYPLAIGNVASITSLGRMTMYHRSTVVYHAPVEIQRRGCVGGSGPECGGGEPRRLTCERHSGRAEQK